MTDTKRNEFVKSGASLIGKGVNDYVKSYCDKDALVRSVYPTVLTRGAVYDTVNSPSLQKMQEIERQHLNQSVVRVAQNAYKSNAR